MRTVKTFSNIGEAGFAHSLLEAAGLHPLLPDENMGGLGFLDMGEGIRLQVDAAEYEQALRVLADGPDPEQLRASSES